MDLYPLLVFLHVAGGIGIFVAMGIEGIALRGLRRAGSPASARAWLDLTSAGGLGHVSMLLALAAGAWMMIVRWGPEPWISTAIVGVVGMAVTGALFTIRPTRRMRATMSATDATELTAPQRRLLASPALLRSLLLRLALGVGILGLMTVRPDLAGSIAVLGVATLVGVVSGISTAGDWARVALTSTGATDAA